MLSRHGHWLALAGAILIEVVATASMKQAALSGAAATYLLTFGGIAASYVLLAVAVQRIPLALAYAVWESMGLVLVVGAGVLLFQEEMSPAKLACVAGVLAGAVLLERGMHAAEPDTEPDAEETAEARA